MACMFHLLMMATLRESGQTNAMSVPGQDARHFSGVISIIRVPFALALAGTLLAMVCCTFALQAWHVGGSRMAGIESGGLLTVFVSKAIVMVCVGICGMCLFAVYYFLTGGKNMMALKRVMIPVALAVMWCCVWLLGEGISQSFDSFLRLGEGRSPFIVMAMECFYVSLWTCVILPLCRTLTGFLEQYFMPLLSFQTARSVQLWIDMLFDSFRWAYNRFIFLKLSLVSLSLLTLYGFGDLFATYILQYDPIWMIALSRSQNKVLDFTRRRGAPPLRLIALLVASLQQFESAAHAIRAETGDMIVGTSLQDLRIGISGCEHASCVLLEMVVFNERLLLLTGNAGSGGSGEDASGHVPSAAAADRCSYPVRFLLRATGFDADYEQDLLEEARRYRPGISKM